MKKAWDIVENLDGIDEGLKGEYEEMSVASSLPFRKSGMLASVMSRKLPNTRTSIRKSTKS